MGRITGELQSHSVHLDVPGRGCFCSWVADLFTGGRSELCDLRYRVGHDFKSKASADACCACDDRPFHRRRLPQRHKGAAALTGKRIKATKVQISLLTFNRN
jgi:hypothetical protein